MSQRISLARPYFDAQELEAVRAVLDRGWIVQGPEVEAFEAAIGRLHGARHCIAVASGTAALHICYLALGIGAGDALFIPSFAWPSAANMARLVGAQPVFVDVLPETCNLDPADLEQRIRQCLATGTHKPRAIVPVHEFGLAAELDPIQAVAARHGLELIEDAACALGARYRGKAVGTFGQLGIFSFHPRKSITTGEGGAIVTQDDDLAEQCRAWRNHGQRVTNSRRDFVLPGLNYRLTEMQAAIGSVQLKKFPEILGKRRTLVRAYLAALRSCPQLSLPADHPDHTWQTFMVTLAAGVDRKKIIERLGALGIEAGPGSVAGHLGGHFQPQPVLPASERLHHQGLALPLHAALAPDQARACADALRSILE